MSKISDITKFTLQDYPGKPACIFWFAGCNMRCKYCHNVEFFEQKEGFLNDEYIEKFLKSRIGLLDGVVLSGGECTLDPEIKNILRKIKNFGFLAKIDTNGLNYEIIKDLVESNLIDFIALDFKAMKNKFSSINQIDNNKYNDFETTLKYLINKNLENKIDLEIRTTIHTSLLQEDDINSIILFLDSLKYKEKYFIQNFKNDNKTTLIDIGEQKYILDKSKIIVPKNFAVQYRNFA